MADKVKCVLICAGDVMAGSEHPVHGGISTVRHRRIRPPTSTSFCFPTQDVLGPRASPPPPHLHLRTSTFASCLFFFFSLVLPPPQVANVPAGFRRFVRHKHRSSASFFLSLIAVPVPAASCSFFTSRSTAKVTGRAQSLSRE